MCRVMSYFLDSAFISSFLVLLLLNGHESQCLVLIMLTEKMAFVNLLTCGFSYLNE